MPFFGKAIYPASWEGWATTVAAVLGTILLRSVDDPIRRVLALTLIWGGYCAMVLLTWRKDAG